MSEKLPFPSSYWVPPYRLLAGQYPGARHEAAARPKIRQLLRAGVTYYLDLTEVKDRFMFLEPYEDLLKQEATAAGKSVTYRRLAIRDMDVPDRPAMLAILNTMDQALADGHTVYVHCWGGVGRTGTVIGCFLVRHGLSGQEALAEIVRLRAGLPNEHHPSPESHRQREMVLNWHED